ATVGTGEVEPAMMPRMRVEGLSLPWSMTPLEALRRWPRDRAVVMLHAGRYHPRWSRYSVLAEPCGAYRFRLLEGDEPRSDWIGAPEECPFEGEWSHRPLRDLRAVMHDDEAMWIGHLGYDLNRTIERMPRRAAADRDWPVVQMHRCPGWLVHDAAEDAWYACGTWATDGDVPKLHEASPRVGAYEAGEAVSVVNRADYEACVQRVIDYIAAGDVFQVNLTHRLTAPFAGDTRALFDALATESPAWYGAYIELLGDGPRRAIASTSPELFLEVSPNGEVTTRPIKGTRPASAAPDELRDSEKDAAELHMIVDLLRNDLGKVCRYGSVRVAQERTIESHPTIHHGVATVTGTLHESKDLASLLRATMPGGSITGAPKVRAMEIIDELEPVRRGVYCGAIGYIHGKEACLNIAIRTMCIETDATGRGHVDMGVGGGIVADSQPAAEYEETMDKAAAMITALRAGKVISHR
ncbi:MAG: anthranilate synthase component I family protein, partial [Phycisphaeraceae bacterium]